MTRRARTPPRRSPPGTLLRWTTPGSPSGSRRSRRCWTWRTLTPTPGAPIAVPPRPSGALRSPSPSWSSPAGCATCAASARASRPGSRARRDRRHRRACGARARAAPELIGLGRYLGLGATRSLEPARALAVGRPASCARWRGRAAADRPASGRATRRSCSRRSPARARHGRDAGSSCTAPGSWSATCASLGGEPAGDPRRWLDSCEHLAVVGAALEPAAASRASPRFPRSPVVEQAERRAVGVTVEAVPIALIAAEPARFGAALVRATGSSAYVAALEPLPDAPDEASLYASLGLPGARRSCARRPSAAGRRPSSRPPTSAATFIATRRGRTDARRRRDGPRRTRARPRLPRDLRPPPAVGAVPASTQTRPPAGRGDRRGERGARAVPDPARRRRSTSAATVRLHLPDDILPPLEWVQLSLHAGQREEGAAPPARAR